MGLTHPKTIISFHTPLIIGLPVWVAMVEKVVRVIYGVNGVCVCVCVHGLLM